MTQDQSLSDHVSDVVGRLKHLEDLARDAGHLDWSEIAYDAKICIRLLVDHARRYEERAIRNARMFQELHGIVDQWCDLQIAHPGCKPDAKALKARIWGNMGKEEGAT